MTKGAFGLGSFKCFIKYTRGSKLALLLLQTLYCLPLFTLLKNRCRQVRENYLIGLGNAFISFRSPAAFKKNSTCLIINGAYTCMTIWFTCNYMVILSSQSHNSLSLVFLSLSLYNKSETKRRRKSIRKGGH